MGANVTWGVQLAPGRTQMQTEGLGAHPEGVLRGSAWAVACSHHPSLRKIPQHRWH